MAVEDNEYLRQFIQRFGNGGPAQNANEQTRNTDPIQTNAMAGNGVGTPLNFNNLYKQLADKQQQQAQQRIIDKKEKRENATFLDNVVKRTFDVGNAITGFGQDALSGAIERGGITGNPIETLTDLAVTLPGGMIGSPIRGLAEGYEVSTGRNVQDMADGTIPAERLTGAQRLWEGIDMAINLGGGPVGATGRAFGALGKGIAKAAGKDASKAFSKFTPNEGLGMISQEIAERGGGKIAQTAGQLAFDAAEEGVEEFAQEYAETGRVGEQFTEDTLHNALQSGLYGAIGGAMMSGAGQAANRAMGPLRKATNDNKGVPDNSGIMDFGPVKEVVSDRMSAPTALKYAEAQAQRNNDKQGSFGLAMAPGDSNIALDDGWIGFDGLEAAWRASDEDGKAILADMLGYKGELDTVQKAIESHDLATLNARINGHFDYNKRAIKREPGTSGTTFHSIYITKVTEGSKLQLHTMTSQLGNGDIDGDVKTILHLPEHDHLLPSQLFLNPSGVGTDFDYDYLPMLDTDIARKYLKTELKSRLGKYIANPKLSQTINDLIAKITKNASKAQLDIGESRQQLSENINKLSMTIANATGNANVASDVVSAVVETMYDAYKDEEVMKSVLDTYAQSFENVTEEMVDVAMADLDKGRTSSGKMGNAKTMSAIAYDMNMITSLLVGLRNGSLMRSGQAMKYNTVSRIEMLTSLDAVFRGAGKDSIERNLVNMMKVINIGEHINENISTLFNNMVMIRFMTEVGITENNKMGPGVNAIKSDEFLDKYIDVRNELAEEFNKATTKVFSNNLQGIVGSIEKIELSKGSAEDRKKAAGFMYSQTLANFEINDFFDMPKRYDGDVGFNKYNGMSLVDAIEMMAREDERPQLMSQLGPDASKLLTMMIESEIDRSWKIQNDIISMNGKIPRMDANDLSIAENYATATMVLESWLGPMDPAIAIELGLWEVYETAKTDFAYYIFNGTAEERTRAQLVAISRLAYSDVIWAFEKYEKTGDEDYYDLALSKAAELRGKSALTRSIYAELREDRTIRQIRYLTDLTKTFDEKEQTYKDLSEKHGIRYEPILTSALSIQQPDLSQLNTRLRDNRKTLAQISEEGKKNAENEANSFINYMMMDNEEDSQNFMRDLHDYVTNNMYEINDEIFVSVFVDSTNIHLHDDEKGTTIASAMMLYQQLEMMFLGGPVSMASEMQERTTESMGVNDFVNNKMAFMNMLFKNEPIYLHSSDGADAEPMTLDRFLNELIGHGPNGENGTLGKNDLRELLQEYPLLIRLLEPHKMTPDISKEDDGSTSQTGSEKTVGAMTGRFQAFRENVAEDEGSVKKRQEKANLEKILMNNKKFHVILGSMLKARPDGTISRHEILSKKNELVEDLYQTIGHYHEGDELEVEEAVIETLVSKFGDSIIGDRASYRKTYNEVAANIAAGNLSIAAAPSILAQKMCHDVIDSARKDIIANLRKRYDSDNDPNNPTYNVLNAPDNVKGFISTATIDQFEQLLSLATMNIDTALSDMRGESEFIDQINGATFAMLGRERIAGMYRKELRTMLQVDRLSLKDDQKTRINGYINKAVETICDKMVDDDTFVTKDDINIDGLRGPEAFAKLEEAGKKMKSIVNKPEYGISARSRDVEMSNIDKILSDRNTNLAEKREKMDKLRIGIDNMIMANAINNIASSTDAKINEHMFSDTFELGSAYKDLIRELHANTDIVITQAERNYDRSKGVVVPNSINLADPRNVFVSMMAGRHVAEGQIGENVGVNGFVLKTSYGLALIPHDRSCNAEPIEIGLSEFKENYMKHLGETVIVDYAGKRYTTIVSDTGLPKRIEREDPNAKVFMYDRSTCTCPFCKNHWGNTKNKYVKNYMMTTASYFDLLSWAQEGKNLKLKKTLKIMGDVVNQHKFPNGIDRSDVNVAGLDDVGIRDAAMKCSNALRDELLSRYKQVIMAYDEDMKDIHESIPTAMAAVNSSVLLLTGVNGEQCYASLYEINDDSMLNEIKETLGGSIVSMRQHPISYEQINSKIESAVMNALKDQDSLAKKDTDEIAWKAVSEWRTYKTKAISAKYLMSKLPIMQNAGMSNIIPAGHSTAEQLLLKAVNSAGNKKSHFQRAGDGVPILSGNNIVDANRKFRYIDESVKDDSFVPYLITDVTFNEFDVTTAKGRKEKEFAETNLKPKDKFFSGYPSGAIIADNTLKKGDIVRMMNEGYKGYRYVIVPKDSVEDLPRVHMKETNVFDKPFYEIDLYAINDDGVLDSKFEYGEGYFSHDQVVVMVADSTNMYGIGNSASIANEALAEKLGRDNATDIIVDCSLLDEVDGPMPKLVERSEIATVARMMLDDPKCAVLPRDNEYVDDIDGEIDSWLKSIVANANDLNMFDERGWIKGTIGINTPFVIIEKMDWAGNKFYMPALASGNLPRAIDGITGVSYDKGTGNMRFHQVTRETLDETNAIKGTAESEASKAKIRMRTNADPEFPKISGINCDNILITDQNAREGRAAWQSDDIAKDSIIYGSKVELTNIAFLFGRDGKTVEINPNLNYDETGNDPKALTLEEVDQLLTTTYNEKTLLQKIEIGEKVVFKDGSKGSKHANLVMRRLARETLNGNGVTLSNFLCPYMANMSFSEFVRNSDARSSARPVENMTFSRQPSGVFRRFNFVDVAAFYHYMNPKLVVDPFDVQNSKEKYKSRINEYGDILMNRNGSTGYFMARFVPMSFMGDNTAVGNIQVNSSFSEQQKVGYALRNGVSPVDVDDIVNAIKRKNADLSGYKDIRDKEREKLAKNAIRSFVAESDYDKKQNLIDIDWRTNYNIDRWTEQRNAQAKTFEKPWLKFKDGGEVVESPLKNEKIRTAFNSFKSALGNDDHISWELFLNVVVKLRHGWSYSDGDGDMSINVADVVSYTRQFVDNLNSDRMYLIEGGPVGTGDNLRISFGLIPRNIAMELWEVSPVVRKKFNDDFNNFKENMSEQQKRTVESIGTFLTSGRGDAYQRIAKRKDALYLLHAYIEHTWGNDIPSRMVYSDVISQDYEADMRLAHSGLFGNDVSDTVDEIVKRQSDALRETQKMIERANKKGLVEIEISDDGSIYMSKGTDRKNPYQKAMNGVVNMMKTMGVLDPGVAIGSLAEGSLRGAVQDLALSLPGTFLPWGKGKRSLDDRIVDAVSENGEMVQFLKMAREADLNGDIDAFLLGMQEDGATVKSVADKLYGDRSWWAKTRDRIFKVSSADTVFLKSQAKRMIKYLDTYITQGDYPELNMVVGENGQTQFAEGMSSGDPVRFLVNMLAPNSPARIEVLRAINTSDTYSMAQRNAVSIITENITQKSSVANLVVSLTVNPYMRYATNIAGRTLNWLMPMSSINYVTVKYLGKFDTMKDMGIERAQVYDKLTSAVISDCAHMAFPAVAAIILALGLIDYPDDDDKKNNFGEYMFAGMRISENFVLNDLTGPLLPYACFMKTLKDGNPRFDLLVNGLSEIASKNPMLKVGEVIDLILSPDQTMDEMEDEALEYSDSPGGKPEWPEVASGTMQSTLMAIAGKMITPSFLRNLGKSYDYQRSYRRKWKPGTGAVDVSSGVLQDTVLVDYDEAMIRRVTRDNPVLGVIWNYLTGADTSYTGLVSWGAQREMTPVLVSDPYQKYIMKEYSIYEYDDDGNRKEKSEMAKQQVALDIIATLQSYDDMEELYDTGFTMDSATRRYVGDVVWQTVAGLQTSYYTWANSTDADRYVLGNGDFLAGQEIVQEFRNTMEANVKSWTDFYYNKLNSVPMKRGTQKYLRENVEWWQDDNGDWYASGFHRGMNPLDYFTSVKIAPGTIDSWVGTKASDEGTLGYYQDWDSPSAVNGLTLGERSLVPVEPDVEETVPFDDLAENNKELAEALDRAKNGKSYGNGSGSGGSGGSGGGGSTNIYSKPSSVNVPSARTMSSSRPYDSKFDYLRPGFETKGSREASRRSDF